MTWIFQASTQLLNFTFVTARIIAWLDFVSAVQYNYDSFHISFCPSYTFNSAPVKDKNYQNVSAIIDGALGPLKINGNDADCNDDDDDDGDDNDVGYDSNVFPT